MKEPRYVDEKAMQAFYENSNAGFREVLTGNVRLHEEHARFSLIPARLSEASASR